MTTGIGTSLASFSNHDAIIQRSQVPTGIIQNFAIAQTSSATLVPTVTEGWIMTVHGMVYLKSSAFGAMTASENNFSFYGTTGTGIGTVYYKTTRAGVNVEDDVYLGCGVTSGTALTAYYPGQWMNSKVLRLCGQDTGILTATSGTYLGMAKYLGPPCQCFGQEIRVTTTSDGSGTVTFEGVTDSDDVTTTIASAVSVGAVTALTTTNTVVPVIQNIPTSSLASIRSGTRISVKTATAASSVGKAEISVYLGGSLVLV